MKINFKGFLFHLIEYFKQVIEILFPGYFSPNCRAIKRIVRKQNIKLEIIYDIGCYLGNWYLDREKTFPDAKKFYLFDIKNMLKTRALKKNVIFFNEILGSKDGDLVKFWGDGGGGSSYFKELGNDMYSNIQPKTIATSTLKSLIDEGKILEPHYIKIDTQGTELEVLKGLGNYLQNDKLYFIELEISFYRINENSPLIEEVLKFMNDNDYLLISLEPLPIVEFFKENKLVQINGIFAKRNLISTA